MSFTLETDGKTPTGATLKEVIEATDAATDSYPAYYMINCTHNTHVDTDFDSYQASGEAWFKRVRSFMANGSKKSHAELMVSTELDEGDKVELGQL